MDSHVYGPATGTFSPVANYLQHAPGSWECTEKVQIDPTTKQIRDVSECTRHSGGDNPSLLRHMAESAQTWDCKDTLRMLPDGSIDIHCKCTKDSEAKEPLSMHAPGIPLAKGEWECIERLTARPGERTLTLTSECSLKDDMSSTLPASGGRHREGAHAPTGPSQPEQIAGMSNAFPYETFGSSASSNSSWASSLFWLLIIAALLIMIFTVAGPILYWGICIIIFIVILRLLI